MPISTCSPKTRPFKVRKFSLRFGSLDLPRSVSQQKIVAAASGGINRKKGRVSEERRVGILRATDREPVAQVAKQRGINKMRGSACGNWSRTRRTVSGARHHQLAGTADRVMVPDRGMTRGLTPSP